MTLGVALACLLAFALLVWLVLPLVVSASEFRTAASHARSELEDLYIQREGTYATLKELDFDHETGKLIEEDYKELRARYSAEAVRILRRIDELESASKGKGARRLAAVPSSSGPAAAPPGGSGPARG